MSSISGLLHIECMLLYCVICHALNCMWKSMSMRKSESNSKNELNGKAWQIIALKLVCVYFFRRRFHSFYSHPCFHIQIKSNQTNAYIGSTGLNMMWRAGSRAIDWLSNWLAWKTEQSKRKWSKWRRNLCVCVMRSIKVFKLQVMMWLNDFSWINKQASLVCVICERMWRSEQWMHLAPMHQCCSQIVDKKGTTITSPLHTFTTHSFSSLDHFKLICSQRIQCGAVATVQPIWKRLASVLSFDEKFLGSIDSICGTKTKRRAWNEKSIYTKSGWSKSKMNEWMNE